MVREVLRDAHEYDQHDRNRGRDIQQEHPSPRRSLRDRTAHDGPCDHTRRENETNEASERRILLLRHKLKTDSRRDRIPAQAPRSRPPRSFFMPKRAVVTTEISRLVRKSERDGGRCQGRFNSIEHKEGVRGYDKMESDTLEILDLYGTAFYRIIGGTILQLERRVANGT